MTAFFRLLSIAGLSMTLLVACSDNETTIEEAYKSAHDQPNETAAPAQPSASSTPENSAASGNVPDKDSAAGAVQAARDAVAASNAQSKKTNEAAEAAIKNN